MKRLITAVATSLAVLAAAQAFSADWKGQPLAVKRQIVTQVIGCMKKRMAADRVVSYNQASKECREEVSARFEKASAGPLVAVDNPVK